MSDGSTSRDVIPQALGVLVVRGQSVMLDAEVAARFGVETRAINQAVARNPRKFREAHCFRLTAAEAGDLKSQSVMSNPARGGFQGQPMVYTVPGVARLATVLTSPEALDATDLILETFIAVQLQVAQGHRSIAVPHADRLMPGDPEESIKLSRKLREAMTALLDAVIDVKTGASLRDTAGAMTADALAHLRDRLRTRGLENDKLAAETLLILKQAELVEAQARKSDAETKGIDLQNLQTSIDLVRQIMDMHREMQPPALVSMLDRLAHPPRQITHLPDRDQEDN